MHVINGYVIPGPDGPIPGMGFEGRREGIDDFRYIQLLEARLEAVDSRAAAAEEARLWLDGLRQIIVAEAVEGVFASGQQHLWELDWVEPSPHIGPNEYATLRDTAAGFILRLPAVPGELNLPSNTRQFRPSGWEGETFVDKQVSKIILAMQRGSEAKQRAAATALTFKKFHDDELPALLQALVSLLEKPAVRMPALQAISVVGPNAVVPALEKQLQSEDPVVRCSALFTLESIGPGAIAALATGLQDPFLMNKAFAAECLGRFGPAAARALPALEAAAKSSNEAIVRTMRQSMELIRQGAN